MHRAGQLGKTIRTRLIHEMNNVSKHFRLVLKSNLRVGVFSSHKWPHLMIIFSSLIQTCKIEGY